MLSNHRSITMICLCLLFFGHPLFSQQDDNDENDVLTFQSWNVSVVGLQTIDPELLDQNSRSYSYTLLPLIETTMQTVETHFMDNTEAYHAREMKRQATLTSIHGSIEKILLQEDVSSLANETKDIRISRRNRKKELKTLQKQITQVERIKNEDIPISTELPVIYQEQIEYITISESADLEGIARALNSHFLIYYRFAPLEEFLITEIRGYNLVTKEDTVILRTIVNPKNIDQIRNSIQRHLQDTLTGIPSSSLQITAQGPNNTLLYDAEIFVNGSSVGFGDITFPSIVSGTHVIFISYKDTQRTEVISLEAHEVLHKTYFFDIQVSDTILVTSNPSNARIYINSEWVGNTPGAVARPSATALLEIRTPEYDSHKKIINSDTSVQMNVTLLPTNPIPLQERINTDRKKFYNAFAIFAISLAVPLILNGLYINELNSNTRGRSQLSDEGANEADIRRNAYFYSSLGAAAVSVGLGIFTYVRLNNYLDTASEYHER